MRVAACTRGLATLVAALLPGITPALDLTGRLGLLYDRTETWNQDTYSYQPRLQFDGNVAGRGAVVDPQYGSWLAALWYEQLNRTYSQTDENNSILGYSAGVSLFERPGTVLGLNANAYRGNTDTTSTLGDYRLTGTTIEETYNAQARVGSGTPGLTLGGWYRHSTNQGFDRPDTTETTKLLDVSAQHGPGPYDLKLDYEGRWNDGSFDILNYTSHAANLHASSKLAPNTDAYLTGRYLLRLPTDESTTNPRYEDNLMTAGVRYVEGGTRATFQYAYTHTFFDAPGTDERERLRQGASGWSELTLTPEWAVTPSVDFTVNQDRIAATEDAAWGASTGALLRWRRQRDRRDLWVEAGPRVGVLVPVDGSTMLGVGARFRARGSWPVGITGQVGADYTVDYDENLQATQGWGLNQVVSADGSGIIAGGIRGRLSISAAAGRRHETFLGDRATRNILLTGTLDWRRYHVQLDAGLRNDVSPEIGTSFSGDGLIIPPAFDTESRYAAISASTLVFRSMTLLARAGIYQYSGPDFPEEKEARLDALVAYAIGKFQLSLEDRYTIGGRSSYDRSVNQFMALISRAFGKRF